MNNLTTLFSLIGGRRNLRLFNIFGNRRTNNGSMIIWSLMGLTTIGIIGSRNTRWVQNSQERFKNLRNNSRIPLQNQVNFANVFAEEITPEFNKNENNH